MINYGRDSFGYDQFARKTSTLNLVMDYYMKMATKKPTTQTKSKPKENPLAKLDFSRMTAETITL